MSNLDYPPAHPMWLSPEEVHSLTGKRRQKAQLRQLKSLGLYSAVRARTDGSFVVLRSLIDGVKASPKKSYNLNLDGLGHVA
jgi:hypothetical protein